MMTNSIKELLEAGVHYGHQTRRWNPKMKRYIHTAKNNVHIIDLQKTDKELRKVLGKVRELSRSGKTFLFVGTKRQAKEAVKDEAKRCGAFFINERWLGGLLTNFDILQGTINKYLNLESMKKDGSLYQLPRKESVKLEKEIKKYEKLLVGVKEMKKLPNVMFIIDSQNEKSAIREARITNIPVLGVVDTDCDPDDVDYPIPGNDDAIKAIRYFTSKVADEIIAGRDELEKEKAKEAAEEAVAPEITVENKEQKI